MSENIFHQAQQTAQQAEREALARQYREALDAGDFDAMEEPLERAQYDSELNEMIEVIHKQMIAEDDIVIAPEELERAHKKVKHIFKQYYEVM